MRFMAIGNQHKSWVFLCPATSNNLPSTRRTYVSIYRCQDTLAKSAGSKTQALHPFGRQSRQPSEVPVEHPCTNFHPIISSRLHHHTQQAIASFFETVQSASKVPTTPLYTVFQATQAPASASTPSSSLPHHTLNPILRILPTQQQHRYQNRRGHPFARVPLLVPGRLHDPEPHHPAKPPAPPGLAPLAPFPLCGALPPQLFPDLLHSLPGPDGPVHARDNQERGPRAPAEPPARVPVPGRHRARADPARTREADGGQRS